MRVKDIIDLGAKGGGATKYILAKAHERFHNLALVPDRCVCIDLRGGKNAAAALANGFKFAKQDVLSPKFEWPVSKIYCAFNFLEHLPQIGDALDVTQRIFSNAKHSAWFRLPSFEDDVKKILGRYGLRLAWDTWTDHPTKFLVAHLNAVAKRAPGWSLFDRFPVRRAFHSMNDFIVPIDADRDATKYNPAMGEKESVQFVPPLVVETEFIFVRRS